MRIERSKSGLFNTKAIVGTNENRKDSRQIFQLSGKTSAPPGKSRDIMA